MGWDRVPVSGHASLREARAVRPDCGLRYQMRPENQYVRENSVTAGSKSAGCRAAGARGGEGSAGQRLDNFLLRELSGIPRSRVYRLLRKGEVRVNGKRKQADYRLAAEDEVRLPPLREAPPGDEGPRRVPDALLETVAPGDRPRGCTPARAQQAGGPRRPRRLGARLRRDRSAACPAARGVARARASTGSRYQRLPAGCAHAGGAADACTRCCARARLRSTTRHCWRAAGGSAARPSTRRC